MSTFSFSRFPNIAGHLLAGMCLLVATCLQAVAPATPAITKVDFSAVGFLLDVNGQIQRDDDGLPLVDSSGNAHSYVVRWQDKAVDEEGYQVDIGADNNFTLSVNYAANATEGFISPIAGLKAGQKIQFRVSAWKFNGSKVEKSTSSVFTYTIPTTTFLSLSSPTNLQASNLNDNAIKLTWSDASTSELYFQIVYRQVAAETTFRHLGYASLVSTDPAEQVLQLRLIPGTSYGFKIRATRDAPSGTSPTVKTFGAFSLNEVTITTPPLTPPTELKPVPLREDAVRLVWKDNSFNETGYKVQYRFDSEGSFSDYQTLASNATSTDFLIPKGATMEWRVIALYSYYPSGSTTLTTIQSAPSNTTSVSTIFQAPGNMVATTSAGVDRTIDLTWEDNTDSEYGFNIYTRPAGTETYYFARAVGANVTKVSVNSRTETDDANGRPVFTPLDVNLDHEFVVRAVASDEETFSADSNVATATVRDGFTSLLSPPIKQGEFFTYLLTTGGASARTAWTVTGLPQGIFFDNSTGLISGNATVNGLFKCPMTATFNTGHVASTDLILRVDSRRSSPLLNKAFGPVVVGLKSSFDLSLEDKFTDPDAEKVVRFTTTNGNIDMILYQKQAPKAVANFMAYVEAGDYTGMAFHRLVSGFVLQGGSLKPTVPPRSFAGIQGRPAVENEPGITNAVGTIAAAKVGARNSVATLVGGAQEPRDDSYGYVGNPDSATTDFFFNLENNNTNLDNQNGGFTVFGRLTNPAQEVVRLIAGLPVGSYVNNNTTTAYSASLDKRILVDEVPTAWSSIPMNAETAPADMNIFKTVRVTKAEVIPNMTYTISTSPAAIASGAVVNGKLRITGLASGTTTMTVVATDLDGGSIQQQFSVGVVKGYTPAVITKQPVDLAVNAGSTATFSVTAKGTNLIYRWRKNGVEVIGQSGAGSPKLELTGVQEENAGLFDVEVKNATTSVLSKSVKLEVRKATTIGTLEENKVVEAGSPLTLQVTGVSGAPAPVFAWKKGTKAVSKQTKSTLTIASAKLSDAGVYVATASNPLAKITSNTVTVYVIDKRATVKNIKVDTDVNLTAPVAGPGLQYRWKKDGVLIDSNLTKIKDVQEPVLKITDSEYGFSGQYTCEITMGSGLGGVETGPIQLNVLARPVIPALTGVNAPPGGFVGVEYSWNLPFSTESKYKPSSFKVTSLPPGLKYNKLTGLIYGKPTKRGVYTFKASATNMVGTSSVVSGSMTILPLPAATIGTLVATVGASPLINGNKGGRLDLTVSDTGSYSAKLMLGAETFRVAGTLGVGSGLFDISSLSYQSRITIPRKNRVALQLALQIDADSGYVSGLLTDGVATVSINGIRKFWVKPWNASPYGDLKFNLGLNLQGEDVGNSALPQGSGYLQMTLQSSGTASFSGRLADGTSVTGSSLLGPGGEALMFQMLYDKKGAVLVFVDVGDRFLSSPDGGRLRVDGEARWIKDEQAASVRTYQAGIPETFLQVLGTNYAAPATNRIVMGLSNVVANARLDFSEGGLNETTTNPDVIFRITTAQKATTFVSNPANVALSITASTGAYSGTFKLADGREVSYKGLIIPPIPLTPTTYSQDSAGNVTVASAEIPPSSAFGAGYFLMPELLPSLKLSKINSGRALLSPTPIQIITQPVSAAVNPGVSATFTVAVNADVQGSISYRWRRNGITIANATGASYTVTNAENANEGQFDCVITNDTFTVISNAATLTVNDPITTVVATRSPSTTNVNHLANVTFSATPNGTAPFTYQWRKDGADIPSATSATFVITAAETTDSGVYSVLVSNGLTPSGVVSNDVTLNVTAPANP